MPQSNPTPLDYLKSPYARVLILGEDGLFSAEMQEFPGCYAQGATAGEAYSNLEAAAGAWIQAALLLGQSIPPANKTLRPTQSARTIKSPRTSMEPPSSQSDPTPLADFARQVILEVMKEGAKTHADRPDWTEVDAYTRVLHAHEHVFNWRFPIVGAIPDKEDLAHAATDLILALYKLKNG